MTEISKEEIESWFKKTDESTDNFIKRISKLEHSYDSIVHAVAASAVKAAWQMNDTPQGGITGFQAGAVMWEFIRRWMHFEGPLKLITYRNMLYPQYKNEFNKTISKETWKYLQTEAQNNLNKVTKGKLNASPNVIAHWESIVNGKVPFGYKVNE